MTKAKDNQKIDKASSGALIVLILLIISIIIVGYIIQKPLLFLLSRHSKDFGILFIYTGLVLLSLISSIILFGIVRSTGLFKAYYKKKKYEFGGAMAGFFVTLIFLIGAYHIDKGTSKEILITGNVRLVQNNQPSNVIWGAKVSISKFSGYETETDKNGNFRLSLPENINIDNVELIIKWKNKTFFEPVNFKDFENIIIEINKDNKYLNNISGKWKYTSDSGNSKMIIWNVVQNNNELIIKDNLKNEYIGHYYKNTMDFQAVISIDNNKIKGIYEGKINENGDLIEGKKTLDFKGSENYIPPSNFKLIRMEE